MQDFQSPPISIERDANSQSELRQAFQQLYKQKLIQVKKFYQKQHESLKQAIESVYKKILGDQLLMTMIGDKTTSTYIQQRIEQLFAQIVSNQRQIIIQKLGIQLNQAKFYHNEAVKKYQKIKQELDNQVSMSIKQRLINQKKKNQLTEQLRKKSEESYKQSLKIKSLEQQLDEKTSLIKQLKMENQLLHQQFQKVDKNIEKAIEQSNVRFNQKTFQITSYKQLAKSLQFKLQQTQNNFKKVKESLQKKCQLKVSQYKLKIQEYKQKMTQLLQQSGINLNLKRFQNDTQRNISQLEIKMGIILRDHEKYIQQLKSQHLNEKKSLQKNYQNYKTATQSHYQKQLQKKIKQVNEQASQYWKKVKGQQNFIKQTIQNYEQNYIIKEEHYNILKERQELINSMKEKIEQDQCEIYQKNSMIDQIEKMLTNLKLQNDELIKRETQNKQLINELKNKCKIIDQNSNNIKNSQNKIKNEFQITKLQVQRLQKITEQFQKKNIELNQTILIKLSQIKDHQRKIRQSVLLVQELERKCKDSQSNLHISNRNSNDLKTKLEEHKKEMSNLQYKYKETQHKFSLDANQFQYKNKKLTEDLVLKAEQLKELQKKYKSMQQEFINLKSTHTEMYTINQRLELQIKHLKQVETNINKDSQLQINQLKKRINDKMQDIQKIKKQHEVQITSIKRQNQKSSAKLKQITQNMSKSKKIITQLSKMLNNNLHLMSKQLNEIRSYCRNMIILTTNQIKINYRLLQNQVIQIQRSFCYQKNQNEIMIKQQFRRQKQNIFFQIRKNQALKQKEFQQKLFSLQQSHKYQILDRQSKISEYIDKMKGLQMILLNSKQQTVKLNNQIQNLQRKRQKQIEENIQTVHCLKSQYQNDRNCLISQYEQKSNFAHQQIQQLFIQIQKIKIQTQNLKSQHQYEKNSLSSQLRTVQQQEQQVVSVMARKDNQIQKMNQELGRIAQNRNQLQTQLRDIWQQNQQKMLKLQQMGYNNQQLSQSLQLFKSKIDRLQQQNGELQIQLNQKNVQQDHILKAKAKAESELKQLRHAIDRNDKFRDVRALQQMTLQTQQLTNKVNQMKKMGEYLQIQNKKSLRS